MTFRLDNDFPNIRMVYLILLFGAITLPMLPVWQGGIRVLAAVVAILAIDWSAKPKLWLGLLLTLLGLTSIHGMVNAFIKAPIPHLAHAVFDVFGQPIGLLPDLALLGFDLLTVSVLTTTLWFR